MDRQVTGHVNIADGKFLKVLGCERGQVDEQQGNVTITKGRAARMDAFLKYCTTVVKIAKRIVKR
jgi:hypothetical protein